MRSPLILIATLLVCLYASLSAAAPGRAIQRRDDPPAPASSGGSGGNGGSDSTNTFAFPALTTTSAHAPATTKAPANTGQQSSPAQAQSGSAAASSPASAAAAAASGSGQAPSATSTASPDNGDDGPPLPITPSLSAVWVVAGIILLASGVVYLFVGIKHKQIQVFLSAAYTTALGITVLIVYILTPPISVGQQGAYLAAIIFPSLIIGAVSVVFKDVTEGLGCGVGGFALAMWLLSLKAGGLISANSGKVILICVVTVLVFSLSFSHHTRTYGLIGATSFGGAMVMILGIDCLAGVGLKEFWPYIWGLNNKLFPLGTTTYPLTKGMIAEIASVPIATLFGILSQIKIWKILQTKREKRAEEQAAKDRLREAEESRRGKDLVVQTEAEKMIWEQTYSEAPREHGVHSDSGIGSEASASEKGSVKRWSGSGKGKIAETNVEVYEMHDLASPSGERISKLPPQIVLSLAEDPEEEAAAAEDKPKRHSLAHTISQRFSFDSLSKRASVDAGNENEEPRSPPPTEEQLSWFDSLKGKSLKPKSTAPAVIPLPFTVSTDEHSVADEDDRSSIATAASSRRASKRFSSGSLLERMTKNRMSMHKKQPSDTSSVQAIADSPTRDAFPETSPRLSRTSSNTDMSHDGKAVSVAGSKSDVLTQTVLVEEARLSMTSPNSEYFTPKNDPELLSPPLAKAAPSDSQSSSGQQSADASSKPTPEGSVAPPASGSPSETPVHAGPARLSLATLPSETISKTVHKYRTNEWAKHISVAEAPEEDDIPISSPPSPVLPASEEVPTPDATEDVPPIASASASDSNRSSVASFSDVMPSGETPPADAAVDGAAPKATWPKRSSRRLSMPPASEGQTESRPQVVRKNSQDARPSSRMSSMRSSSNSRARNGKIRQSTQPITTSPIQEDVEATFVPRNAKRSSTLPTQAPTLLDRRESMMSQTSLVRSQSQVSVHKAPITNAMYNASRSSLLSNGARPVSQMSRRASNPEQLNFDLSRQASTSSLRDPNQPYSPPPPVRTYSPMPNLGGSVAIPVVPMQAITHANPVAPADRPLHYRSYTPNNDLMTQRMAAWRSELHNDSQNRRVSSMAEIDLEYGAAASTMGSQWLAQQRQARLVEQAGKQTNGWAGNGTGSPPPMSPMSPTNYVDPRASAAMQSQAHQDVMRRMQSKAKPK